MKTTAVADNSPTIMRDQSRTIGAILVEHGRLSPEAAERVQEFAAKMGLRFGDAALRLKLLTEGDIDMAIAQQFKYPILQRSGAHGIADEVVAGYLRQSQMIEPLC